MHGSMHMIMASSVPGFTAPLALPPVDMLALATGASRLYKLFVPVPPLYNRYSLITSLGRIR